MPHYSYLFKFIIIGDSNVGKSCLQMRFIDNNFKEDNEPTIGVEFASKNFHIRNKDLKLQIWDTAGQENFRSITRSYFRAAIGALIVFDITNKESYTNVVTWLDETRVFGSYNLTVVIIGNKSD